MLFEIRRVSRFVYPDEPGNPPVDGAYWDSGLGIWCFDATTAEDFERLQAKAGHDIILRFDRKHKKLGCEILIYDDYLE